MAPDTVAYLTMAAAARLIQSVKPMIANPNFLAACVLAPLAS